MFVIYPFNNVVFVEVRTVEFVYFVINSFSGYTIQTERKGVSPTPVQTEKVFNKCAVVDIDDYDWGIEYALKILEKELKRIN